MLRHGERKLCFPPRFGIGNPIGDEGCPGVQGEGVQRGDEVVAVALRRERGL